MDKPTIDMAMIKARINRNDAVREHVASMKYDPQELNIFILAAMGITGGTNATGASASAELRYDEQQE